MHGLGDEVVLQGVCRVRAVLDGRIGQAVPDGQALQVQHVPAVLQAIVLQGSAHCWDVVPACVQAASVLDG